MDWLFLLSLGIVLFLTRDLTLLGSIRQPRPFGRMALAYGLVFTALFTALAVAAQFVSRDQALSLLRDARLWVPASLIHALLFIVSLRWRTAKTNGTLWPLLLPTPVFLYCAAGLCWMVLRSTTALEPLAAGAMLGVAWTISAVAGAWCARKLRNRESSDKAVFDFAAASHLSAILLLPFQQFSTKSALTETELPSGSSSMALAATVGLIGASFLFHRLRRTP